MITRTGCAPKAWASMSGRRVAPPADAREGHCSWGLSGSSVVTNGNLRRNSGPLNLEVETDQVHAAVSMDRGDV